MWRSLYLASLVALGINPQEHDIRFVEDNWEAPTLGSLGAGLGNLARRYGSYSIYIFSAGSRN